MNELKNRLDILEKMIFIMRGMLEEQNRIIANIITVQEILDSRTRRSCHERGSIQIRDMPN